MSVPEHEFTIKEDVGRYFRLTRKNNLYRQYIESDVSKGAGTTHYTHKDGAGNTKWYQPQQRFKILAQVNETRNRPADGKAYEILLVLFDVDLYQLEDGEVEGPIKIDNPYIQRLAFYNLPGEVVEGVKALSGTYDTLKDFDDALDKGLDPDHKWNILLTTRTGYLWNIYADDVYAERLVISVPEHEFTIEDDVGRYFRLTRRNGLFFDYAPPANPQDRGTTNLRRGWYEEHQRFEILQRVHVTKASRVDGKAYEVLLVLFDIDRFKLEEGEAEGSVKIDAHYYFQRLAVYNLPEDVVAWLQEFTGTYDSPYEYEAALWTNLLGDYYEEVEPLEAELEEEFDDDFSEDLLWWEEIEELPEEEGEETEPENSLDSDFVDSVVSFMDEILASTQTGYLWSLYEDNVYITPEMPTLKIGANGIDVVALQVWLKMVSRHLDVSAYDPGPVDGLLGPQTMAAVKSFNGDNINEQIYLNDVLAGRDTWYALDSILRQYLPPDPLAVEPLPFPGKPDYEDLAYRQRLANGLRVYGFDVREDNEKTLRRGVKLFKALGRDIDLFENEDETGKFPNVIADVLEETVFNVELWNDFPATWGGFYGAPWMGIMVDNSDSTFEQLDDEQLIWGTHGAIQILTEWGRAYLKHIEVEKKYDLLKKPIMVRHLARPLGGRISNRPEFSQIGQDVSFHVPRKASVVKNGKDTGKFYGGVSYDSPDFDRDFVRTVYAALNDAQTSVEQVIVPDEALAHDFSPGSYASLLDVRYDPHPKYRSINQIVQAKTKNVGVHYVTNRMVDKLKRNIKKWITQSGFEKLWQTRSSSYFKKTVAFVRGSRVPLQTSFPAPWGRYVTLNRGSPHSGIDVRTVIAKIPSLKGHELVYLGRNQLLAVNSKTGKYYGLVYNRNFSPIDPLTKFNTTAYESIAWKGCKFTYAGKGYLISYKLEKEKGKGTLWSFNQEFEFIDKRNFDIPGMNKEYRELIFLGQAQDKYRFTHHFLLWDPDSGKARFLTVGVSRRLLSGFTYKPTRVEKNENDPVEIDLRELAKLTDKKKRYKFKFVYLGHGHVLVWNLKTGQSRILIYNRDKHSFDGPYLERTWQGIRDGQQLVYASDNHVIDFFSSGDYRIYRYYRTKANNRVKEADSLSGQIATHNRPIPAVADGVVVKVHTSHSNHGIRVDIDHTGHHNKSYMNGVLTYYAHLRKSKVRKGQMVKRGQVIGVSGTSMGGKKVRGIAPHLHFMIIVHKKVWKKWKDIPGMKKRIERNTKPYGKRYTWNPLDFDWDEFDKMLEDDPDFFKTR